MKSILIKIKLTYRPGKEQEFGWLPACWHCEVVSPRFTYGAFLGQGATEKLATEDLVWKIKQQRGETVTTKLIALYGEE